MKIKYNFNGKNFKTDYGVRVKSAEGLLDIPDRKDIKKYEFPDSSGYSPELTTVVYEERKITIDAFIKADTAKELVENYYKFCYDLKSQTDVKPLQIVIEPTSGALKILSYNVYCEKISQIKKRFTEGQNIGSFTITFIEPEPNIENYE